MVVLTQRFGQLEVPEDKLISFPDGLPGFEDEKTFFLVAQGHDSPFIWLQSATDPRLVFVTIVPGDFVSGYHLDLSREDLQSLDLRSAAEGLALSIVVVPENPQEITANLKAPVVINPQTRRARQIIVSTRGYELKHRLFTDTGSLEAIGRRLAATGKGLSHIPDALILTSAAV